MKPLIKSVFMLGFVLAAVITVHGQKPYSLKSHKISVDGTSSLHDWTSAVEKVDWSGQLLVEGTHVKTVSNVAVTIAVKSIKSEKGGMMDDKTYEAFKEETNPNITFKQTSATVTGDIIKANGNLTMAGVTKPIVLTATAKVMADGSVHVSGSQIINMKDHGMKPPKAVMGTIKVGEKVTLLFELTLVP